MACAFSGVSPLKKIRHVLAVAGHQHLVALFQKEIESDPGIGDQAGSGTGSLEHACGGREPVAAMHSRAMLSTALGL